VQEGGDEAASEAQPLLLEADKSVLADHEVIYQFDIKQFACPSKLFRCLYVLWQGRWVA